MYTNTMSESTKNQILYEVMFPAVLLCRNRIPTRNK